MDGKALAAVDGTKSSSTDERQLALVDAGDEISPVVTPAPLRGMPGRMPVVAYLNREYTPFYRLVLDVLLEEESRLGLHLPTAEVARRVESRLSDLAVPVVEAPPMESLLAQLYDWGNVDRIQNSQRKGSYQEYLKRDYLYQLTPAGAQVHRELTRIDAEMGTAGALQSSMLPEVLAALRKLVEEINSQPADLRAAYASLRRVINGFTQLSENAKLFVQGLGRALELDTELKIDVFLAYKQVVVDYLQVFVLALMRYSSAIAEAITQAEDAGIKLQIPRLALIEAAPVVGMSTDDVADRDAEHLRAQWDGMRRWFFGDADRPPVAQILQDRAADAVNRIVATVRRLNDHRFRRMNRAADLLTLAVWFAGTYDRNDIVSLWRASFGMYPARHFGAPHLAESDLDMRPKASWWESPSAPVEARLRKHGPRASVGRPPSLPDPRIAKRRLAVKQAEQQAVIDAAVRVLADRSPVRLSQLHKLLPDELDTLLRCLDVVLSTRPDSAGTRRARTSDGRLQVELRRVEYSGRQPDVAVVHTDRGDIAVEEFELTIEDLRGGYGDLG